MALFSKVPTKYLGTFDFQVPSTGIAGTLQKYRSCPPLFRTHFSGNQLSWCPFVRDPFFLVPGCPGPIFPGAQLSTTYLSGTHLSETHLSWCSFVRDLFFWDPNVLVPNFPGLICPRIIPLDPPELFFFSISFKFVLQVKISRYATAFIIEARIGGGEAEVAVTPLITSFGRFLDRKVVESCLKGSFYIGLHTWVQA